MDRHFPSATETLPSCFFISIHLVVCFNAKTNYIVQYGYTCFRNAVLIEQFATHVEFGSFQLRRL